MDKPKESPVKRFHVVARALGVDPDAVLGEFCTAWLERVRSAASPDPDGL